MSDYLYHKQQIPLGIEDYPIVIPHEICLRAASTYQFSLVAVPLNPRKQNLHLLVHQMPWFWGVGDLVFGRIIAPNKVLFVFPSEELMNHILHRGPWSFADWMITLHRWSPDMVDDSWKWIPLWIQIKGIPLQLLTRSMIGFIGSMLAPVKAIDFDAKTTLVDFVRVRVLWNIEKPLRFQRRYQFGQMENSVISFKYEQVRNFCQKCGMMSHDNEECPVLNDSDEEVFSNDGDNEGYYIYARRGANQDRYVPNLPQDEVLDDCSDDDINDGNEDAVAVQPLQGNKADYDLQVESIRYLFAKLVKQKLPKDENIEDSVSEAESSKGNKRKSQEDKEGVQPFIEYDINGRPSKKKYAVRSQVLP